MSQFIKLPGILTKSGPDSTLILNPIINLTLLNGAGFPIPRIKYRLFPLPPPRTHPHSSPSCFVARFPSPFGMESRSELMHASL